MILFRPAESAAAGFPPGGVRRLFLLSLGLVFFFYPFGFLFVTAGVLPPQFSWTGSFVISLYGVTALFSEYRRIPVTAATAAASVLGASLFGAEYVGVTTGFPFGSYAYTDVLGIMVAGVPLAISVAWYATVISSWRIAQTVMGPGASVVPVAILAGVLTVLLDIALEPMAWHVTRYWEWAGEAVPLQNYLSWFLFTVAAVLLLSSLDRGRGAPGPGHTLTAMLVYGLQLFFFAVTDLVHGHATAALISVAGVAAVAVFSAVRNRAREALQP